MDIEQLKLIIEALASAGDGAFTFGIIFLAKGFIIDLLFFILLALLTAKGLKLIQFAIGHYNFIYDMQRAIGAPTGELRESEKQEILKKLRE